MVSRSVAFLALLFIVNTALAQESIQESIMPNISDTYIEKLVTSAKAHYPKAKMFEDRVKIAHINVQKAKIDWFSIFTFNYIWTPPNNASSSAGAVATTTGLSYATGASFGIGTNLGMILQKPGLVKVAREEYDSAQMNEEEYLLNLTATVKQRSYVDVQQMSTLNFKTKMTESADHLAKEAKYKFEKGEQTFDQYNSAYLTYSNTVQSKMDTEVAFLIAKSSLEEIIGVKLEEIK